MSEAPKTLEGWYALHDLRRLNWARWKAAEPGERTAAAAEFRDWLAQAERADDSSEGGSALYAVPGHKGDVMLLHLRPAIDDLIRLELSLAQTRLADFMERTYSYVSVTELSQYASGGDGPPSPEAEAFIARRLKPAIPDWPYMSFYPMSKKREADANWYSLPLETRRTLMHSHGSIGRAYKDEVRQMITGSMGFDDWEWGVTLYAVDALPLKKIVHEMRFDEGSAKYGLFGPFFLGKRLSSEAIGDYLDGRFEPAPTK